MRRTTRAASARPRHVHVGPASTPNRSSPAAHPGRRPRGADSFGGDARPATRGGRPEHPPRAIHIRGRARRPGAPHAKGQHHKLPRLKRSPRAWPGGSA
eukprot:scaffold3405_cov222-Prasinococcus_capsulatus_cf.AAC.6